MRTRHFHVMNLLVRVKSCLRLRLPSKTYLSRKRYVSFVSRSDKIEKQRIASLHKMSDDLWSKIVNTYDTASQSGAAFKTPTQIELIKDPVLDLSFVLRISESLDNKPPSTAPGQKSETPKRNPFLPYDEALWVTHLSDSHTMLLNKFNLVDRHVLIVTREFESQNEPLTLGDISATWNTIKCIPQGGLAFFNSGSMSGASQPHKHTQIVPLPLSNLISLPFDELYKSSVHKEANLVKDLPFLAYGVGFNGSEGIHNLHEDYYELIKRAREHLGDAFLSYNLVWTRNWMILIPRSQAASGPCNLNALVFAGTIFVRSNAEVQYVKTMGPMKLLENVAFPNPNITS
eukprot:g7589.t1